MREPVGMSILTTSPSKVRFGVSGVPPNWLNWTRSLRERIALRTMWKSHVAVVAKIARAQAEWPIPTPADNREVDITCWRVRSLDPDGLYASVTPVINGLKYVQYVRINKRLTTKVEGAGLIYDDASIYYELIVHQLSVAHFADERIEIEVRR